jgi:hypothetical protein
MMSGGDTRFERELKKRITEEIQRLTEIICAGDAIKDYADYKLHVGRLKALDLTITEYFDDVQTTLNKE